MLITQLFEINSLRFGVKRTMENITATSNSQSQKLEYDSWPQVSNANRGITQIKYQDFSFIVSILFLEMSLFLLNNLAQAP